LRALLAAQFAYERMQAISLFLVYALALIGVVVWIAAVRPGLLPSWASELSEASWGAGLIGLIIVILRGRHCGKEARRLADESKTPDHGPSGNEPE
jgi:hypothetical protein